MGNDQASLFEDTPAPPRRPTEPILRTALVEGDYRFWLKRAWGQGPMVAWAMLNPSVADGSKDDPTMLRVMEFSLRWGFGSCVVVNIYPFITPLPAEMKKWRDGFMRGRDVEYIDPCPEFDAWRRSVEICAKELSAAERCVAAWGNGADGQDVATWLEMIAWMRVDITGTDPESVIDVGLPVQWVCLGTTNSGAPKHPLARGAHRVPPDFAPVPWRQP